MVDLDRKPPSVLLGDVPMEGKHVEMEVMETDGDRIRRRNRRILISVLVLASVLIGVISGMTYAIIRNNGNGDGSLPVEETPTTDPKPPTEPNPPPEDTPDNDSPVVDAATLYLQSIKNFLSDNGISSSQDLDNVESPQSQAAVFMASSTEQAPSDPNDYFFLERYIMTLFFYATGGEEWTHSLHFLNATMETCDWNQLTNPWKAGQEAYGATCSNNGIVSSLVVVDNNLKGSIPSELGLLTALEHIDLNGNYIVGSIPSTLSGLHQLTYLGLHSNNITGSFPQWITDLSNLEGLALGDNRLTGSFPPSMGEMTKLAILAVDDNQMTGNIDFMSHLTYLEFLYVENNSFTGTLNSIFMRECFYLVHLDASDNQLTGVLPVHFFYTHLHPRLEVIDLSNNQLTGGITTILPTNRQVEFLAMQGNPLGGSLPGAITHLEALTHLDLSATGLTGPIPADIGSLTDLEYLFLANNGFQPGHIPDSFAGLTKLQDLSLQDTQRTGAIPTWFRRFDRLFLLDLKQNQLVGKVPKELSDMKFLAFLLLSNNTLSGEFPTELAELRILNLLSVEHNSLTGSLDIMCENVAGIAVIGDCGGDNPKVGCECCNLCCEDGVPCHEHDLFVQFEPTWEERFDHNYREFDSEIWG